MPPSMALFTGAVNAVASITVVAMPLAFAAMAELRKLTISEVLDVDDEPPHFVTGMPSHAAAARKRSCRGPEDGVAGDVVAEPELPCRSAREVPDSLHGRAGAMRAARTAGGTARREQRGGRRRGADQPGAF